MTHPFRGRREDQRLITGQGRFTSDWNLPGQLHGHFLRSDRAHAEIVSLDVSAARAAPGVKAVLTGDDVRRAGFKQEPPLVRYPGRGGMKLLEPHRDALAVGRVRHVGQEVALVVADSPAAAQDAAEKIEIEYRDVPAIVEVDDALAWGRCSFTMASQATSRSTSSTVTTPRCRPRSPTPRTSHGSRWRASASSAIRWSRNRLWPRTTRRRKRTTSTRRVRA